MIDLLAVAELHQGGYIHLSSVRFHAEAIILLHLRVDFAKEGHLAAFFHDSCRASGMEGRIIRHSLHIVIYQAAGLQQLLHHALERIEIAAIAIHANRGLRLLQGKLLCAARGVFHRKLIDRCLRVAVIIVTGEHV